MKTIRPNSTDPAPVPRSPLQIGHVFARFIGLLVIAVVLLMLAWSR